MCRNQYTPKISKIVTTDLHRWLSSQASVGFLPLAETKYNYTRKFFIGYRVFNTLDEGYLSLPAYSGLVFETFTRDVSGLNTRAKVL
jgi:hypothetical protein